MTDILYIIGLAIWLLLSSCPLALTHCCCGCNYFTDNFSTDNLATDYTAISGSWSVSGGKLTTNSSNGFLLVNTTSVSNYHNYTITPTLAAVGDTAKVVAGYQDADNYLFAELTRGASNTTARFYKVVAGVQSQVGTDRTLNSSAPTVSFCCSDNKTLVLFSWTGGFSTITCRIASVSTLSTGNQVGVGTGTVVSGVSFDNLTFARHKVDNPDCADCAANCSTCGIDSDYDNSRWKITITGWAKGTCPDSSCEDFHNGQWYSDPCSGVCTEAWRYVAGSFCTNFFTEFGQRFRFPATAHESWWGAYIPPLPTGGCVAQVMVHNQLWGYFFGDPNVLYEANLSGSLAGVHNLPLVWTNATGTCDTSAVNCDAELIP